MIIYFCTPLTGGPGSIPVMKAKTVDITVKVRDKNEVYGNHDYSCAECYFGVVSRSLNKLMILKCLSSI